MSGNLQNVIQRTDSSLRVAVIGAGISGMMAAALLTRRGHQVYLFDRAKYPGGSAGYYMRQGTTYPTGATMAFGLEHDGPFRRLLETVDVPVEGEFISHSMDVVLADRTVHIYTDKAMWYNELSRVFAERSTDVIRFWQHLERTANVVYQLSKSYVSLPIQRITDFGHLPSFILRHPLQLSSVGLERNWTVEDALMRYDLHTFKPFRRFLDAQLIDAAQVNVTSAAWLPSAVALDVYRHGIVTLPMGFTSVVNHLLDACKNGGAAVHLAHTVTSASYNGGKGTWTLTTNRGSVFETEAVINASGVSIPTFEEASAPNGEHDWQAVLSASNSTSINWGALRLDAIVPRQWLDTLDWPVNLAKQPFSLQIATPPQLANLLDDPDGALYITLHPPVDSAEEQVLTASLHTPAEKWKTMDKDTYRKEKAIISRAVVAEISHVLPGFSEQVLEWKIGTPQTYQRYLNKSVVGGMPMTVDNCIRHPCGSRTDKSGWFLAGDGVFPGPGTLSAALSGLFAARAVDSGVMRLIK